MPRRYPGDKPRHAVVVALNIRLYNDYPERSTFADRKVSITDFALPLLLIFVDVWTMAKTEVKLQISDLAEDSHPPNHLAKCNRLSNLYAIV